MTSGMVGEEFEVIEPDDFDQTVTSVSVGGVPPDKK